MAENFEVYYLGDKNSQNISADNRILMGIDTTKWEIKPTAEMILEVNLVLDGQPSGIVHYRIVEIEKGDPRKIILCEIARENS